MQVRFTHKYHTCGSNPSGPSSNLHHWKPVFDSRRPWPRVAMACASRPVCVCKKTLRAYGHDQLALGPKTRSSTSPAGLMYSIDIEAKQPEIVDISGCMTCSLSNIIYDIQHWRHWVIRAVKLRPRIRVLRHRTRSLIIAKALWRLPNIVVRCTCVRACASRYVYSP